MGAARAAGPEPGGLRPRGPSSMSEPVRVLVVDDHPVVREGLAAIIGTQRDMVVVGEAANGDEAFAACAAQRPDVTLMDLCLPGLSGVDVAARLRERWPDLRVIMFTSFAREQEIYEAFKAGACSYIRKGAARSELLQAIRAVHQGHRYISPEIGRHLADHVNRSTLTARELQVLKHVMKGSSNRSIASALELSEHTVNIHVKNILGKLGASGRTEAVALALKKGILQLD
jgi:two-component system, NarL family, response regulator